MNYLLLGDYIEIALKLFTASFLLAALLSFAVIQTRNLYKSVRNIRVEYYTEERELLNKQMAEGTEQLEESKQ